MGTVPGMVRHITSVMGCAILLVLLHHLLFQSLDIEATTDALAATSTATLSLTCVSPTIVAFAPDLTYTLTIPAATAGGAFSAGNITATASITNAVNGDSNPTITVNTDTGPASVTLYHTASFVKIGGVQCSTSTQAKLEAYGDGADDLNFDVAVASTATTTWLAGNQIDNKTSGTAAVLFGTSGILGTNVNDGSDADGITNGEIAFGGSGAASAGGHRLFSKVKYLSANPSGAIETLTYIFTPM